MITEIKKAIKEKNFEEIQKLQKKYNFDIDFNEKKIVFKNKKILKEEYEYWDLQQNVRKILLNSLYGALLNEHCLFFDKRLGQSVTLTGRCIIKFMGEKINELITGEKNHEGDAIIYGDTDSVCEDSLITTNIGIFKIKDLFDMCAIKWDDKDKFYACDERIKILTFDPSTQKAFFKPFLFIYKHKTNKKTFIVEDIKHNKIKITEDHSIMVMRNGSLISEKPEYFQKNDCLITIKNQQQ